MLFLGEISIVYSCRCKQNLFLTNFSLKQTKSELAKSGQPPEDAAPAQPQPSGGEEPVD